MSLITLEYVDVLDTANEKKVLRFSEELLQQPVNKASLFVIKVDGESMQPLIQDRALVVADLSQKHVEDKRIYLVHHKQGTWIKQAQKEPDGRMKFVSINRAFSHLVYEEEEVRVIAKAVLTFTKL